MVRRCREYAHPRLFLRLVLGKRHNLRSSLLDGTFPVCTSQELAECKPLLLKLVIDSQPMKRVLLLTILLHFFCNTSSFGCLCGPPEHASKYVKQASLVFVGKVVFTNDDGSGISSTRWFILKLRNHSKVRLLMLTRFGSIQGVAVLAMKRTGSVSDISCLLTEDFHYPQTLRQCPLQTTDAGRNPFLKASIHRIRRKSILHLDVLEPA